MLSHADTRMRQIWYAYVKEQEITVDYVQTQIHGEMYEWMYVTNNLTLIHLCAKYCISICQRTKSHGPKQDVLSSKTPCIDLEVKGQRLVAWRHGVRVSKVYYCAVSENVRTTKNWIDRTPKINMVDRTRLKLEQ